MSYAKFSWKVFDDALVTFATAGPVADADWDGFLKALKQASVTKYLSATIGATSSRASSEKWRSTPSKPNAWLSRSSPTRGWFAVWSRPHPG